MTATAVLIAVLLLLIPDGPASRIKEVGSGFFLPFISLRNSIKDTAKSIPEAARTNEDLKKTIAELEARNMELTIRLQEADEAIRQYNNLADFLNFPQWDNWEMVAGRVVTRDPANWWRSITIDVGRNDGVDVGMPVVTTSGMVGKIAEVHGSLSKVVLLGDDKCRVGAMLYKSREAGVVRINNSNRVNPMIVDFDYLPSYSNPEQGDWVLTSGLGGLTPKGIRIGQVLDSETVGYGLYKRARVRLAVKMSSLEYVMVIKKWPQ